MWRGIGRASPREVVERRQGAGRRLALHEVGTQRVAELSHERRGRQTVPRDIADDQRHRAAVERDGIEPVAADARLLARGLVDPCSSTASTSGTVGEITSWSSSSDACSARELLRGCLQALFGDALFGDVLGGAPHARHLIVGVDRHGPGDRSRAACRHRAGR